MSSCSQMSEMKSFNNDDYCMNYHCEVVHLSSLVLAQENSQSTETTMELENIKFVGEIFIF